MKMVKSLILGSAAALVAMSGAQAADLPVKAKAVEYVKVCSLYGAGFFYIPGSDTCIKLGGYLRVDTTINGSNHGQPAWSGDLGQGNRFADMFASRSRFALTVDTRTATEYGVVRTFAQTDFTFNNFGNTNPASLSSSGTPTALAGISGNLLNGVAGGYANVEYAFIQFAGFTIGKSSSAFSTPWNGFPGNNTSYLLGGNETSTGLNNIQYTAQFGNGVSGTIGLDDPTVYNRTALYNLAAGGTLATPFGAGLSASGTGANAYGGFVVPDLVGNVRVDQAWGLFQLSGVVHSVNASYNTLASGGNPAAGATALTDSVLSGHPDSKVGGAIMAALQIKNLPTGPGDDIKFDTTWSKGDTKEVISAAATSPNFAMIGGVPGQFGPSGTIGLGATTDGVFLPALFGGDGSIHLTTAYGLRGAFNHNWDPYWSTSLFGGAGWVKYDNTAKGYYCAAFGVSHPGLNTTYSCDPNYSVGQIGVITRWTPVKNLTFSAETMYTMLHQNFTGSATFSPGAPQPNQTWTFHDQSTVQVELRVQRNF